MWFGQIDLRLRAEEKQYFTMKRRVQKCLKKVFLDPKHQILKTQESPKYFTKQKV